MLCLLLIAYYYYLLPTVLVFLGEPFFPYFCRPSLRKSTTQGQETLPTVYCLLLIDLEGPTGFDRMCEGVCQHAGSWGESLER